MYRANPNKSLLNILEKRERGRIQGLPKFFWVPPIISGTGKATDFKFCRNMHRVDPNISPWKKLRIVAVGVVRSPIIFRAPMYRAHCAVIFAIAQLSCYEIVEFTKKNRRLIITNNIENWCSKLVKEVVISNAAVVCNTSEFWRISILSFSKTATALRTRSFWHQYFTR